MQLASLSKAIRNRYWGQPSIGSVVLIILFLSFASPLRFSFVQGNHCDSGLRQSTSDSYGYRLRGDRCEGIYIKEVSGASLRIVSLTEWVEDFDPAINQNLIVQWTGPGKTSVHLRAYGLRHRLYYRMDSLRPADSTSYSWSPNLLAALTLKKNELGLVAWFTQAIQGEDREVYLPIRLTQKSSVNKSNRYNLRLLASVELTEVFVSLAPLQADGKPGTYIKRNEALRWGYYPAERPINIVIPELTTRGIYYLEVGATLRSGGSSSTRVWFYHQN